MSSWELRREVESASIRSTDARGKHFLSAASARWVPIPWQANSAPPQSGHFAGSSVQPPQTWQRRQESARW